MIPTHVDSAGFDRGPQVGGGRGDLGRRSKRRQRQNDGEDEEGGTREAADGLSRPARKDDPRIHRVRIVSRPTCDSDSDGTPDTYINRRRSSLR
ncbi:MAG: hypothetical protein OXG03_00125 [Gammaproteobacteria bacterium]|nr:hypothetical protein [Gammaproteobacteria bacterium]